jgi:hypothetical protein
LVSWQKEPQKEKEPSLRSVNISIQPKREMKGSLDPWRVFRHGVLRAKKHKDFFARWRVSLVRTVWQKAFSYTGHGEDRCHW